MKSGQGDENWLKFFKLSSLLFAHDEDENFVCTDGDPDYLRNEIKIIARELKVVARLQGFGHAIRAARPRQTLGGHFFLMNLIMGPSPRLIIRAFDKKHESLAQEAYLAEEKNAIHTKNTDVVLIALDKANTLRIAYPNYFLDTTIFLNKLQNLIHELRDRSSKFS